MQRKWHKSFHPGRLGFCPESPWHVRRSHGCICDEWVLSICLGECHYRFKCELFLQGIESLSGCFQKRSRLVNWVLACEPEKWSCNQYKFLEVGLEEVAETDEKPDSFDVGGRLGILDCFKLILSGFDAIQCEGKSEVGNLLVFNMLQILFQYLAVMETMDFFNSSFLHKIPPPQYQSLAAFYVMLLYNMSPIGP